MYPFLQYQVRYVVLADGVLDTRAWRNGPDSYRDPTLRCIGAYAEFKNAEFRK